MTGEPTSRPRYTAQAKTSDKGVRMVDAAIGDKLGWIFREQFRVDLGIDAQVEIVQAGKGTGRLLALQIKCGLSWFDEEIEGGWLYRGQEKHLSYWLSHSLPVIVCLCNPQTDEVFWVQITESNITRGTNGWTVKVPSSQILDEGEIGTLTRIAGSLQHTDIIELLIPRYLQERYSREIYIHPILETPHDFHGLNYMTTIGHDVMFVDFIYTPLESLDAKAIERRIEWRDYNEQTANIRETRLHILVISESAQSACPERDIADYIGSVRDVEFTRLVYSSTPPFALDEIDNEGRLVYYDPGGDRFGS
ncbi:DUF4365 domain-containing protein [Amycolatopsis sp. lyj-84]|uniref:DUF4365 domain-containing protein n=1 Tax=Amycolatopsis sp. lyj-84 TaxID=2789284 RepID=UPI00397A9EBF